MAHVIFKYNGHDISIHCDSKDKFEEIIKKFFIKSEIKDDNKLYFLYGGNKVDENLTFEQVINGENKEEKELTIVVEEQPDDSLLLLKNKYKTKDILCPKCGENILLRIKDYKINLYNCKNGHNMENILLSQYENTKFIDPSNTLCSKCQKKNINNSFNNKIFICPICQINLCPLCKSTHDKNHKLIDFNERYSKCFLHNEDYIKYCTKCKLNICMICENEHKSHNIVYFGDILPDKAKIKDDIIAITNYIDNFNGQIENIISKLYEIKDNIEVFLKICNEVVNDYETKKRNFQILMNIKELEKYKMDLFKDIGKIINEDNIIDKFNDIMNIGYKMSNQNNKKKSEKDIIIEKLNTQIVTLKNNIKENNEKIKDYNYQQPYSDRQQIYQGNYNYQQNNNIPQKYNYQGNYNNAANFYGTRPLYPQTIPKNYEEKAKKVYFHEHPLKLSNFERINCNICHFSAYPSYKCERCSLKLCQSCLNLLETQSYENSNLKHPHLLFVETENKGEYKCNNCRIFRQTGYYFYCKECNYYKCPVCKP